MMSTAARRSARSKPLVNYKEKDDAPARRSTFRKEMSIGVDELKEVNEVEVEHEMKEGLVNSSKKRKSISPNIDLEEEEMVEEQNDYGCPLPSARKRGKRSRPLIPNDDDDLLLIHPPPDEEMKEQPDLPEKELIKQPATAAAAIAAAETNQDQMMVPEGEEVKESDTKKQQVISEPLTECVICAHQFPKDQIRVLPCLNIICRSCGIEQIRLNEKAKNTLKCPFCTEDHILAHSNVVVDAAVLIDKFPTLKQSLERPAHIFAVHESTTHPSCCSYSKCNRLATHFCKDGCGLLCDQHDKSVHQHHSGHECSSFEEVKKKKAVTRVNQAMKTSDTLVTKLLQLTDTGDFRIKYDQDLKDCIEKINSRINAIQDVQSEGDRWINNLQHSKQVLIDSSTQMEEERHKVINTLQRRLDSLQQSGLLAVSTSLTVADDEFQRLVLEEVKSDLVHDLKHVPVLPRPQPFIRFGEELKASTILPPLTLNSNWVTLQSFLKKSGKSLMNASLLYKASSSGWAKDDFMRCCVGKSDTIILIQVAGTEYVFGAYLAPAWPPVAIELSSLPITFGHEVKDAAGKLIHPPNMMLFFGGRPANHPRGMCINPQHNATYEYQLDEEFKKTAPEGFKLTKDTFGGDHLVGASEIEVFQL